MLLRRMIRLTAAIKFAGRNFIKDLLDRGAMPGTTSLQLQDLWGLPGALIAGASIFATELNSLVITSLGLPIAIVSALLALLAAYWSAIAIVAKAPTGQILAPTNSPTIKYVYTPPVRWIAKLAFICSVGTFPILSVQAAADILPLPTVFYGYVIDAKSGRPLPDVRLVAIDTSYANSTSQASLSDSVGFYIMHTTKSLSRSSQVLAYPPECKKPTRLSLLSSYEVRQSPDGKTIDSRLRPVFRHSVGCEP